MKDEYDFSKGRRMHSGIDYSTHAPEQAKIGLRLYAQMIMTLLDFFKRDEDKVLLWLDTPNPTLGGQAPNDMIVAGRIQKLHAFVMGQIAENLP